ncbi:hypothetical protein HK102_003785, partial [Quaeritorhiza haematococci]
DLSSTSTTSASASASTFLSSIKNAHDGRGPKIDTAASTMKTRGLGVLNREDGVYSALEGIPVLVRQALGMRVVDEAKPISSAATATTLASADGRLVLHIVTIRHTTSTSTTSTTTSHLSPGLADTFAFDARTRKKQKSSSDPNQHQQTQFGGGGIKAAS